ncbi:unnamed protein product [Rotaria socialis]|uniref:Uncharacterized protein n=2 Tax=Rotaria socialis TaxID=392032 RepID=A0A820DME2_9BILA|nr:unnamed protein product [Rotaria socialis]
MLEICFTDRNQPTRSWIRNELIVFNGNSLEEDADSYCQEYVKEHWEREDVHNCIKAQCDLDPDTLNDYIPYRSKPICYACNNGDLNLVRELVEYAYADINQSGILTIAIEKTYEALVDYVLSQGYNYHVEYLLQETSSVGYLGTTNGLLKYGADTDIRIYDGHTALDFAILGRHIDVAKALLLHKHGHIKTNGDNFTPMMLAVHHDLRPIVDLLFQMLPIDRAVGDLLRVACRYTIDLSIANREKTLYFCQQGLCRKQPSNNSVLYQVYDFCQECQTFDQLESIRNDDNAIRMNALLVSEKNFLQHGDAAIYIGFIETQCFYNRSHHLFYRSLQLRTHKIRLFTFFTLTSCSSTCRSS